MMVTASKKERTGYASWVPAPWILPSAPDSAMRAIQYHASKKEGTGRHAIGSHAPYAGFNSTQSKRERQPSIYIPFLKQQNSVPIRTRTLLWLPHPSAQVQRFHLVCAPAAYLQWLDIIHVGNGKRMDTREACY
jgi:hypothetical protein